MNTATSTYLIVFVASYLLTALVLWAYKAALNDLRLKTRQQVFRELRAVHPIALLSGFVSLIPLALVRRDVDTDATTYAVVGGVAAYFLATLLYRRFNTLKLVDFSIDNGTNFNDEVSADPTPAQKIWLYLVSWAGAVSMGALLGLVLSYNSWKDGASWLTDQPSESESTTYLIVFAGFIVASFVISWMLRRRSLRRLPTISRLRRALYRTFVVPSIFGLIIAFLQDFTRNQTLTNRYWTLLIFTWIALLLMWNLVFALPSLRRHLAEDRVFFEQQQKRLRRQRNKKRKQKRR